MAAARQLLPGINDLLTANRLFLTTSKEVLPLREELVSGGEKMRIPTTPPLGAVQSTQVAARTDRPRSAFELPGGAKSDTPRAEAARPGMAAAGLETLLAVQGMMPDDRREKRRRAMKRGHDALGLLDDLKLALLSGEPMPAVLLKLRGLTAAKLEASGDDGLDGVLAEIDLRAQVEIAKREAARAVS
ncbi:flagellar assembly protein FliX [Phreatobacter stygius]|uniref:Flagellar assembly regulator FliX n=1 Tax=Phreatobacter stygius TaxID=1940610 RepID=A0A4D7APU4_9HYPH|nr:flagellar assembly protein FliX [Phreatobacter stygius]QCI63009.1 flagellar assembly regulator FliX [Phreatobacter stygius]